MQETVATLVNNILQKLHAMNQEISSKEDKLTSIILPIFGTGNADINLQKATVWIIESICDFLERYPTSDITDIYISGYRKIDGDQISAVLAEQLHEVKSK